jgi:hypothetical protein
MAKKKEPTQKKPSGAPPVPPEQRAQEQFRKSPRQPPREEEIKVERPRPGRFHPGRGDLGGRS